MNTSVRAFDSSQQDAMSSTQLGHAVLNAVVGMMTPAEQYAATCAVVVETKDEVGPPIYGAACDGGKQYPGELDKQTFTITVTLDVPTFRKRMQRA